MTRHRRHRGDAARPASATHARRSPPGVALAALIAAGAACAADTADRRVAVDSAAVAGPAVRPESLARSRRVGAAGGEVDIPGYVRVVLPPRSLADSTLVSVSVTATARTAEDFDRTVAARPVTRAPWEVRVSTGRAPPAAAVEVVIVAPAAIRATDAESQLAAFALVRQDEGEEVFDGFVRVAAAASAATRDSIRVSLPPDHFSARESDGAAEAVVVLARVRRRR